jgi:hypothetical protein
MTEKPDFNFSKIDSPVHLEWLGKAVALVSKWNRHEADLLQIQINSINPLFGLTGNGLTGIFTRIYKAISDLEFSARPTRGEVFAPSAVYDFFRALREQILSAQQSILIVDPYMDAEAFDKYCHDVPTSIAVRLLIKTNRDGTPSQYLKGLKGAVGLFNKTYEASVEIRQTGDLHDRILLIDSSKVWVIGQSIKDAANESPTYFIPLDGVTASLKREHYERIWTNARSVCDDGAKA